MPFADVGPFKVPEHLSDEKVVFLTDIFPTGYEAAENCSIQPGDRLAVWGCGPVGLFALKSASMLGADRVIGIDRCPERLDLAARFACAETLNYEQTEVGEALKEMTGGRGPDACIDAVGREAHGLSIDNLYDKAKQLARPGSDRPHALRQAIICCRKGGTVSIPGVYAGLLDKIPFGAAHAKSLTFKMGQTHVHRYLQPLMARIEKGEVDPSQIISHRCNLEEAPEAYRTFKGKRDGCVKVVMTP